MSNHRRHRHRLKPHVHRITPGTRPGTLSIAPNAQATAVRVMAYDKDHVVEQVVQEPRELAELVGRYACIWVDVSGLGNEAMLLAIGQAFQIHPLALEDVVHAHQRAKVDTYDENLLCVLRIPDHSREHLTEQFSLVLGKNYLVTFQERHGDCFETIRADLRNSQSATRQRLGPDYLAYRLIDAAIDSYFPILEHMGDHLDQLDEPDAALNSRASFAELHIVRRELLLLRRAVWPIRDAMSELRSESTEFICDATRVYLRDCYDHAVQLIDLLESYRDIAGDVRDYYLSSISNRMNEVMKTLTVIATIFLPLSFIAGVYGMNFDPNSSPWNMPETRWRFGYFFALALMAAVAIGMLLWFKHRGWLGSGETLLGSHQPPQPPPVSPRHPERHTADAPPAEPRN